MEQTMAKYRIALLKVTADGNDKLIRNITRPCTEKKAQKIFNQLVTDWGLQYDKETGFTPALTEGAVYPAIVSVS